MTEIKTNLIYDNMSERIVEVATGLVVVNGAHGVNVRMILKELGITNRVFYNRFHNIDEVLEIISKKTIMKVRESLKFEFDKERDFFEQVMDVIEKTLIISYETRMKFAHYVFESDSSSNQNYDWWTKEIKGIIEYGIKNGYVKDVDIEEASYALWCFIRGFNADAIGRNLPIDEALKKYRYVFKFIFDGLKNQQQ